MTNCFGAPTHGIGKNRRNARAKLDRNEFWNRRGPRCDDFDDFARHGGLHTVSVNISACHFFQPNICELRTTARK